MAASSLKKWGGGRKKDVVVSPLRSIGAKEIFIAPLRPHILYIFGPIT